MCTLVWTFCASYTQNLHVMASLSNDLLTIHLVDCTKTESSVVCCISADSARGVSRKHWSRFREARVKGSGWRKETPQGELKRRTLDLLILYLFFTHWLYVHSPRPLTPSLPSPGWKMQVYFGEKHKLLFQSCNKSIFDTVSFDGNPFTH